MANATLKEILDTLGEDRWILQELSEDEARLLGEDLIGFSGALRKSKYSVHQVLGIKGDEANVMIVNMLKTYLNSMISNIQSP